MDNSEVTIGPEIGFIYHHIKGIIIILSFWLVSMDQSHKTNNKQNHHSKSLPSLSPNINALPLVHPQRHSLKHPSSPECSNQHIIPLYYCGKEGE